ncbi:unnamed protein product [Bursaphelenchus xylophilus]|uniref:(pine wood nematode) hypothetical protein n=1 Tax=Bursaphelenchus xylophilus TaxID=6326 RepID=A0A1I7S573_BURXY|nr:unnamed protein product [Bursaphelenchus xylophilus]CAG9117775.1 unnamed protein product [Bursaphelenchus xylophilus]
MDINDRETAWADALEIIRDEGADQNSQRNDTHITYSRPYLQESVNHCAPNMTSSFAHGPFSGFGHSFYDQLYPSVSSPPQLIPNPPSTVSHANQRNHPPASMFGEMNPIEKKWIEFRNSVVLNVPLDERLDFLDGLDTLLKAGRLKKLQKTFLKRKFRPADMTGSSRKRPLEDDRPLDLSSQPKRNNQVTPHFPTLDFQVLSTSSYNYQTLPNAIPQLNSPHNFRRDVIQRSTPIPQQMMQLKPVTEVAQVKTVLSDIYSAIF